MMKTCEQPTDIWTYVVEHNIRFKNHLKNHDIHILSLPEVVPLAKYEVSLGEEGWADFS